MPERFKVGKDNQTSTSLARSLPHEDRPQGKQNVAVIESTYFREVVWRKWRQNLSFTNNVNERGGIQQVKSVQSALSDLLTTSATHGTFSRPSTKRGLILIGLELNINAREALLMIFSESVNRSTCLSLYLTITRLRNVNLLCFSDSIQGIDFLNCTLKCPVTLKFANQNRYFY